MSNDIPKGWIQDTVSNLIEKEIILKVQDGNHGSLYPRVSEFVQNGIPLVAASNIDDYGNIDFINCPKLTEERAKKFRIKPAKGGDVFFTHNATVGRTAIIPEYCEEVIASTSTTYYRVNSEYLLNKYLYQYFQSPAYVGQLKAIMGQTTRNQVPITAQKELYIVTPPLPEQQKIAKILTSVDEVIEKTQAQIDKLKDLKTGMMQELLTNGIGHTEFKDSPVGRIPAEWEVKTLLEVCSSKYAIVDGPFGSNLKTEHYRSSGIPVFQSGFVTSNKFVEKKYVYVDQSKYDEQKRSSAKAGDILMAKIGMNAGACAIIPSNHTVGILAGNSLKITVDSNVVLSEFILGIIHSMQNTGEIRRLLTETAQPAISITTLKKMKVPIPSVEEQKMIVKTFNSIDKKIDIETDRLNSRNQLKKALMQDLLTGKVRINTESTNTEVAVG